MDKTYYQDEINKLTGDDNFQTLVDAIPSDVRQKANSAFLTLLDMAENETLKRKERLGRVRITQELVKVLKNADLDTDEGITTLYQKMETIYPASRNNSSEHGNSGIDKKNEVFDKFDGLADLVDVLKGKTQQSLKRYQHTLGEDIENDIYSLSQAQKLSAMHDALTHWRNPEKIVNLFGMGAVNIAINETSSIMRNGVKTTLHHDLEHVLEQLKHEERGTNEKHVVKEKMEMVKNLSVSQLKEAIAHISGLSKQDVDNDIAHSEKEIAEDILKTRGKTP